MAHEHHGHHYRGEGKQSHGADGSHQHSHKKHGGVVAAIHEGMPSELESYHHGPKDMPMPRPDKAGGM